MAEYIKRTDVMRICEDYSQHCFNSSDARGQDIADRIFDDVVEIPTADVVEMKHGEWERIIRYGKPRGVRCSLCGRGIHFHENFCPSCGSRMHGQ